MKLKPLADFWSYEPYHLRDGEALKQNLLEVGFSQVTVTELSTFVNVNIEDHLFKSWNVASTHVDALHKDAFLKLAKQRLLAVSKDGLTVDFEAITLALACTK